MIVICIQGAGAFPAKYKNEITNVEDDLKTLKGINGKLLFFSRKLCRSISQWGLPVPSSLHVRGRNELQFHWCYKGLYIELKIVYTEKETPLVKAFQPIAEDVKSSNSSST